MKHSLRHQKIIELVTQKGYASTEELVVELDVSPQTIRRDLNILAEQDLIRRIMVARHLLLPQRIPIILNVNNFSLPKKAPLLVKW